MNEVHYFLNPYSVHAEEFYSSTGTFDDTISYLKVLSNVSVTVENALTIDGAILVIETHQGVFIRTQDYDWCNQITSAVNNPIDGLPVFEIMPGSIWNEITKSTKYPINSLGDQRLAIWKVGF
jgi:hypothetical protein